MFSPDFFCTFAKSLINKEKEMKNLVIFLITSLAFMSCDTKSTEGCSPQVLGRYNTPYSTYYKIDVDGHWYLCGQGIVHLESCPCHYKPEDYKPAIGDTDNGI